MPDLSNLTSLTQLWAHSNNLSSLPDLPRLTSLTHLVVYDNELSVLPDLSRFTSLTLLDVGGNELSALPGLSNLTSLTKLWAYDNELSVLPDLSRFTSLTLLDVGGNELSALPGLSNLTSLTKLWAYDNELSLLPDLSRLTSLTLLNVGVNELSALPGLSNLTSLTQLWVHRNELSVLPNLSRLTSLTHLVVYDNELSVLPDLSGLTTLTHLSVYDNELSVFPNLSRLVSLTWLDLGGNELSELPDLSNLTSLTLLSMYGNEWIALPDLSANSNLEFLDLRRVANGGVSALGTRFVDSLPVSLETLRLNGFELSVDDVVGIRSRLVGLSEVSLDAAVVVSGVQLTLPEGSSKEYRVVLATRPRSAVTVTPTSTSGVSTSPHALTFTDWGMPQTVTVAGLQDADGDDASATISHSVTGDAAYAALSAATIPVTVEDDEAGILSALALTGGDGTAVALDPRFEAGRTSYTATVGFATDAVTVTATAASNSAVLKAGEHGAPLEVVAGGAASGAMDLVEGDNTIIVRLSAQRGAANEYQITVTRATGGICGRTPEVQTAILEQIPYITDCANVTLVHLSSITGTLNLQRQGLTALKEGDFDGLTSLARLSVLGNRLTALPDLSDLTSLTHLWAFGNKLSSLPDLSGLTSLTKLSVNGNELSSLPDLSGLTSLTHLSAYDNKLSSLPDLSDLTSLTHLWVFGNELSSLPDLSDLASLSRLYAHNNDLTALPDLSGNSRLVYLDLSRDAESSGVSALGEGFVDGLPVSLRTLRLGGFDPGVDDIVGIKSRLTGLTSVTLDEAVAVSDVELAVPEGGFKEYRVVLATRPGSAVTVTPTAASGVSASPRTLTFTDWGVPQTVTVAAPQDADGDDVSATISHAVTGNTTYAALSAASVKVTVEDDDASTLSALALTGGGTAVTLDPGFEAGRTSYTATVGHDVDTVTVTATAASSSAVLKAAKRDETLETLTSGNASGAIDLAVGDNTIIVQLSAQRGATNEYQITITRETAGAICTRTAEVQTAILDRIPDIANCAHVTLAHLSAITGTLNLGSKGLAALKEGDFGGLTALTHLDVRGNGLSSLPDLSNLTSLTSLQASGNELSSLPDLSGNSQLRFLDLSRSADGGGVSVLGKGFVDGLPVSLQTVRLEGFKLGVSDIVGIKSRLTGLTSVALDAAVAVSDVELAVPEGGSKEYRVVLATRPGSAVTVTPTAVRGVSISPGTLTFTDWGVPQTVTVAGSQDADGDDASATVGHEVTGDTTYAALSAASVKVTVEDDDAGTLSALALTGGGAAVVLDPGFEAGRTSYTAAVGHDVETVTVTATAASGSAVLRAGKDGETLETVAGGDVSGAIDLAVGDNAVVVRLSAQRGVTGEYRVTVTRAARGSGGVCGRTPAVRDAIVALVGASGGCGAVAEAQLAAVTGTLDVSDKGLTSLMDGDFDGLAGLGGIDVSGNRLTSLPGLGDLSGLVSLDASGNWLTSLPGLKRLTGLTSLDVSDNRLSRLPGMGKLTSLISLDVSDNRLTVLPNLNSLSALTSLDASDNQLKKLPNLNSLTALTSLDASGNRLTVLPSLDSLGALTSLDVSGNRLTALPGLSSLTVLASLDASGNRLAVLPGLRRLRALAVLDVGGNQLKKLPDLSRLRSLTGLDVSSNRLKKLPSLARLSRLVSLDVSGNQLAALPDVSAMSALRALDVGDNKVTALPTGYLDGVAVSLESLGLAGLVLTVDEIVSAKTRFGSLRGLGTAPTVALSSVALEVDEGASVSYRLVLATQPDSTATVTVESSDPAVTVSQESLRFADWGVAQTVTVSAAERSGNTRATITHRVSGDAVYAATSVPQVTVSVARLLGVCSRTEAVRDAIVAAVSEASDCASVTDAHLAGLTRQLSVNGRGLTALKEGDFDGLTKLKTLDLSDNSLTALPSLSALESLTSLDVSDNSLTALPSLSPLGSLTSLDVSGNSLTALPSLSPLGSLASLVVSDNSLSGLPSLSSLGSLTQLNVSGNQLVGLPSLDALGSLRELYAFDNQIAELPSLAGLGSLTVLHVSGNQLRALPAMSGLTRLESLHAHDNELESLPDLSANTALKQLVLRRSRPADLPAGFVGGLPASLNTPDGVLRLFGFTPSAGDIVALKTGFPAVGALGLDPTVAVSKTALSLLEGRSADYVVVLATRPRSAVTVTAASSSPAAELSGASLRFTDWGIPQTVTVSAAQDSDDSDAAAVISHTATGDTAYTALTVAATGVQITDDESALAGLALTADGETVELSPAFAPTGGSYSADVASSAAAVVLTATAADASNPPAVTAAKRDGASVAVTVGAPTDPISLDVGANTIDVTVASGSPNARTYTITVTRATPPPMTVAISATSTNPAEGTSTTLTAALDGDAPHDIELLLTTAGTATAGDYTLSPAAVTIPAGKRTATATITIADDSTDDDNETILVKATSTSIVLMQTAALAITIADNDSAPAAPAAPKLTGGDASLTATWIAPAVGSVNGSPSPTTGYEIRYRPQGGNWSIPITATGMTANIAGLTNNTAHQLQIRALNTAGPSPWSPSAVATPAPAPAAPAGLTATSTLDNDTPQITLTWTTPPGALTGYRIQYKQTSATAWTDWPHTTTTTTATITPTPALAADTAYDIRIAALNHDTPSTHTTTTTRTPPAPPN